MHDLAVISTIKSITPIEGKDRIVIANVENYNCIVAKDEFNVDEKVVYVFYDSILPEKPEFEFLRKRCWSEKYKGFRIRPMKMGNVISEGLVLPLSMLPAGNYQIGDVVTDLLGIRLYDPEALDSPKEVKRKGILKYLYKFKWFRNLMDRRRARLRALQAEKTKYDPWTKESDEENIEKCYDKIKELCITYIVTEKVEGTAALYSYSKGKFKAFSHHRRVHSGDWYDYAEQTNLKHKLKKYCEDNNIKGIAIAGELIGPKIQHNIYNRDHLELYLYGGYNLDRTPLSWDQLRDVARALEIPIVPFLGMAEICDVNGKCTSLENLLKTSEGTSVLNNVPREGEVYRSLDGNVHFKVKSRSYKIWFEKREPLE